MITGDKQETAINIATSCKLISNPEKLLLCNAPFSEEGAHAKLRELLSVLQHTSTLEFQEATAPKVCLCISRSHLILPPHSSPDWLPDPHIDYAWHSQRIVAMRACRQLLQSEKSETKSANCQYSQGCHKLAAILYYMGACDQSAMSEDIRFLLIWFPCRGKGQKW